MQYVMHGKLTWRENAQTAEPGMELDGVVNVP